MSTINFRIIKFLAVIGSIVAIAISACSSPARHSELLTHAASLEQEYPDSALSILQPIDPEDLSQHDRAFRNLLLIRCKDILYLPHTSDTLIRELVEYYKDHDDEHQHYPEALYCAGRIHYHSGDYPTALDYYNQALENIDKDSKREDLRMLRACVLSQAGWLFDHLGLYEHAKPYYKEIVEEFPVENDTLNMAHDMRLLGAIYMHLNQLDSAMIHAKHAYELSLSLSPSDQAMMRVYIAAIEYAGHNSREALKWIRNTVETIDHKAVNLALSYAVRIYHDAGIYDTAYMYARQLINSPDDLNKITGYHYLLKSPALTDDIDSIKQYVNEFSDQTLKHLMMQDAQAVMLQNSRYNYSMHEREKEKAVEQSGRMRTTLECVAAAFFIVLCAALYFRNRQKSARLHLYEARQQIAELRQRLESLLEAGNNDDENTATEDENTETDRAEEAAVPELTDPAEQLRNELRRKYLLLAESSADKSWGQGHGSIPSDTISKIMSLADKGMSLAPDSRLWKEIRSSVAKDSPDFIKTLSLLAGSPLSTADLQILLLIRCGISPTAMTVLFKRTKGAISSRRRSLSAKLFGTELSVSIFDRLIRLI